MKYIVISTPLISWKIKEKSSTQLRLTSLPGCYILSPVSYSKAYEESHLLDKGRFHKLQGHYFLKTTGLLVKYTGNDNEDLISNKIFEYVTLLFRYIRLESLHLGIKTNSHIHEIGVRENIKKGRIDLREISSLSMRATKYVTLLSWNDVANADKKLGRKIKISIAEELLLDALDALLDRQFDKTILFSAIAIEALLTNHYHSLYEKKIKAKKKDSNLRIITDKKRHVTKDPIFKLLIGRTPSFKNLLHEIPLYLMKKSILIENEPLYSNLIKLYKARNQIVHLGKPLDENENDRLSLSEQGANEAFDMALDTFKWMKISRFEVLRKRRGFITVDNLL